MRRGGEFASRHRRLLLRGARLGGGGLQSLTQLRRLFGETRDGGGLFGGDAVRLEKLGAKTRRLFLGAGGGDVSERVAAVLGLDSLAKFGRLRLRRLARRLQRRHLLFQPVVLLLHDARAFQHELQTRVGVRRRHLHLVLSRANRREKPLELAHPVRFQSKAVTRRLRLTLRIRQARARHVQGRLRRREFALRLLPRAFEFGVERLRRGELIVQRRRLARRPLARALRLRQRPRQSIRLPLERLQIHHVLLVLPLHGSNARVRLRQRSLARVQGESRALTVAFQRRRRRGESAILSPELLVRADDVIHLLSRGASGGVRARRRLARLSELHRQLIALAGDAEELGVDHLLFAGHRGEVLGDGAKLLASRRRLRAHLLLDATRLGQLPLGEVEFTLDGGAGVGGGHPARLRSRRRATRLLRRFRLAKRASLRRRERFGARVELPLQSVLIGVERLDHRARALRLVRRLFGATALGDGGVLRLAASRLRVARPRLRRLELLHQILARRVKPGDERFQLVHLALRLIELATLRTRSLGVSAEHLARLAERLSRRLRLGDGVVAFGGGHLKFADARGGVNRRRLRRAARRRRRRFGRLESRLGACLSVALGVEFAL